MTDRGCRSSGGSPRFAHFAGLPPIPNTPARHLAALALVGAVAVSLGLAALYAVNPVETPFFPRCPLHTATGLQCPGCGTARALHAALHGRFAEALRFNAALPATLAILALAVSFPRLARSPVFSWSVLALVLAWGVVRNLVGI